MSKTTYEAEEYALALAFKKEVTRKFFATTLKRGKETVYVVYEVDAFVMQPRPFNLKGDEQRIAFTAPAVLANPVEPYITFSFFLADSKDQALDQWRQMFIGTAENVLRKTGVQYSLQDIEAKMTLVEFISL
jgi:hypothetical protein